MDIIKKSDEELLTLVGPSWVPKFKAVAEKYKNTSSESNESV